MADRARGSALTLEDLARITSVRDADVQDDTVIRLAALVRADPRFADQLQELERMKQVTAAESLYDGWAACDLLRELVEAEGWEHPAEVIHESLAETCGPTLIPLIDRSIEDADDPERLLAVRERLARSLGEYFLGPEVFQGLVERLLKLEPEDVESVLRGLGGWVRFRHEHPEWQPPATDGMGAR